jgi:hypothetical protein
MPAFLLKIRTDLGEDKTVCVNGLNTKDEAIKHYKWLQSLPVGPTPSAHAGEIVGCEVAPTVPQRPVELSNAVKATVGE